MTMAKRVYNEVKIQILKKKKKLLYILNNLVEGITDCL